MGPFFYGGEGGIRTLDTLPYTHFPGVLLRPLGHLSVKQNIRCRDAYCLAPSAERARRARYSRHPVARPSGQCRFAPLFPIASCYWVDHSDDVHEVRVSRRPGMAVSDHLSVKGREAYTIHRASAISGTLALFMGPLPALYARGPCWCLRDNKP